MSRSRLQELGIDVPVLPATAVGSFPKSPALLEARALVRRGEAVVPQIDKQVREATAFWIRTQEEVGLDILVDGEQYRGDMVGYFAEHLRGFKEGGLVRCYGNRYYRKPVIVGEVRWRGAITVKWWEYAQGLASRPVKGVVTGPYTLMDWSFNEHYSSRRAAVVALARAIHREVRALVDAGCRIIQVDEPALSARPEELRLAIDGMEMVTGKLPAYFVLHTCYGAFASIYPAVLKMPVHNFDLEVTNSGLDLQELARASWGGGFGKDLSLGVFDVHVRKADPSETIERRIKRALKSMSSERVWVDPDCGLKTRTADEARAQLESMCAAVKAVRKGL